MARSRPAHAARSRSLRCSGALAALLLAGTALSGCGPTGDGGLAEQAANFFSPVEIKEMRAAATEPEVKAFYVARQWKPAWSAESGKGLMEMLQGAQRHGLDPTPFVKLIQAAEGRGARDAELTLAPQDAEYKGLSEAYLAYQKRAEAAAAAPIPAGPTVRVGAADPRLTLVAARMAEEGYLAAAPPAPSATASQPQPAPRLAPAMAAGLKVFQADQDLPANGMLDDATAAALNTVAADRARQLALNLERRRWLARDPAATRIDVNTATTTLIYLRAGRVAWKSRAVAGSAKNQTPALGETFKQLVVNPPWNVPDGIAKEEILPKGQAYLDEQDMYVEDGRVVQRPGPKAERGQVKFDMQNKYAIYLHDTPSKAAFARGERHLSHGCVRVERAVEFARLLATDANKGPEFDEALASGETKVVELGHDLPVRLLHHTAYVDDQGRIAFTGDPYGWDDKLAAAGRPGGAQVLVSEFGP